MCVHISHYACLPHHAYETHTVPSKHQPAYHSASHRSACKFISHCDSFLPGSAGNQGKHTNAQIKSAETGWAHNAYCVLIKGRAITPMECLSREIVGMCTSLRPHPCARFLVFTVVLVTYVRPHPRQLKNGGWR